MNKSAKSDEIANLEQAQTTTPKIAQFESAPSRLVLLATATIYVMNTFGGFIPFRIIPQRQDNAAKAMATKTDWDEELPDVIRKEFEKLNMT